MLPFGGGCAPFDLPRPGNPFSLFKMKMYSVPDRVIRRFFSHVEEGKGSSGCWVWKAAGKGYGKFSLNGEYIGAHVASHILFIGPVKDGQLVCHSCDHKWCVNPEHLSTGTVSSNTKESYTRGLRKPVCLKFEKNGNSKLTRKQVEEIRQDPRGSYILSKILGIPRSTIRYARIRGME